MPTKVREMNVTSTTETTIEALRRRPLPTSLRTSPSLMGRPHFLLAGVVRVSLPALGGRASRRGSAARARRPRLVAGSTRPRHRSWCGGSTGSIGIELGGRCGDGGRGIRHVVRDLGLDVERLGVLHDRDRDLGGRSDRCLLDGDAPAATDAASSRLRRRRAPRPVPAVDARCGLPRSDGDRRRWRRSRRWRSSRTMLPAESSITRRCIWSTMPASCVAMIDRGAAGVDALEQRHDAGAGRRGRGFPSARRPAGSTAC